MDRKVLKWNFVLQYGWVLTNIFNSILLLPLYLHNIDVATLGIWLATGSILGWMTMVDPGIGEVLQQRIAELRGKKENGEIGKTMGSGFMASVIILLVSLVLGYICYLFTGAIIDKEIDQYPHLPMALVLSIAATGLSLVSFGISGMNQGMHNSAQVAIAALLANFLFLFVNVIFLFMGFGVLSIAIANLCRAVFINIYNIISLLKLVKREALTVVLEHAHFKKFIRIFSFTSASKIISSLSYSIDMIILERFIPAAMITMYEINKRPVNITYALIGRHCVALLPLISHAKGTGDKPAILNLVNKQFRIYAYAAMFAALIFCFNYENLITAWTGKGQYAGNIIVYLLVANMFASLICYFIANIAYALGDIKMNSLYNIIRGIVYGCVVFIAIKTFGITGVLAASLGITLLADLSFYSYRLYKLGYMQHGIVNSLLNSWALIVPIGLLGGWGFKYLVDQFLPADMYFSKLLVNGGLFTIFFLLLVLLADSGMRTLARQVAGKFILAPLYRIMKA